MCHISNCAQIPFGETNIKHLAVYNVLYKLYLYLCGFSDYCFICLFFSTGKKQFMGNTFNLAEILSAHMAFTILFDLTYFIEALKI